MTSRREFIRGAGGVAALCGLGGGASLLASCAGTRYVTPVADGGRYTIPLSSFGAGAYIRLRHDSLPEPVAVYRDAGGGYTALSMKCTHKGCTVRPAPTQLVCPCHGAEFSATGKVTKGPAEDDLPSYPVSEESGNLIIVIR